MVIFFLSSFGLWKMMLQSALLSYFFREQYPVFPDDKEFMWRVKDLLGKQIIKQ